MPLYRLLQKEEQRIGIWKITESEEELKTMLPQTATLIGQTASFRSDKRRLERLAVRALTKTMGVDPQLINYRPSGAPYLVDHSYYYSCSHTNNYVAVSLHKHHPTGIDIEQHTPRVVKISRKFMHPQELDAIAPQQLPVMCMLYWSAKESIYKIIDLPAVDFQNDIRIFPFVLENCGEFTAKEYKTSQQHTFQINYCNEPDFVLTYASVTDTICR